MKQGNLVANDWTILAHPRILERVCSCGKPESLHSLTLKISSAETKWCAFNVS